jgi:molybdopterin converting factor small subunit
MDELKVRVLYFGLIRGPAATGEETLSLPAGATVRQLIAALCARHGEGFRESLFWEDGEPLPFVTVLLDGRDIFHLSGLDTPLPASTDAQIVLMPAAMGGG